MSDPLERQRSEVKNETFARKATFLVKYAILPLAKTASATVM
jgi:hypothetical protein